MGGEKMRRKALSLMMAAAITLTSVPVDSLSVFAQEADIEMELADEISVDAAAEAEEKKSDEPAAAE